MPVALAVALQVVVSAAVLAVIVQVFWQQRSYKQELRKEDGQLDLRLALLAAGTLLATPSSWTYDTPLLMLSVIPLLARSWRDGWDGIELVSVTALLISPYGQLLAVGSYVPFAFLALAIWFGVLYRRYLKETPGTAVWLAIPGCKSALLIRRTDAL